MSDQDANEFPLYQANAGVGSWPIANGITVFDGMLCGLEGGYLNHWADGADDVFLGVLQRGDVRILAGPSSDRGKMIGATSDSIPPEAQVDTSGATIRGLSIGGTATQAKVGDPVYCATSNRDDITLTVGAHKRAVGWMSRYYSATKVDITLHPASKFAARAEMGAIVSITDSSGGTGTDAITVGAGVYQLSIPIALAGITSGVDIMTDYILGHKFKIVSLRWVTTTVASTGSKNATVVVEIGATPVTSVTLTLDSDTTTTTTLGGVLTVDATGANTGSATDTISLVASTVTAFVEGSGCFILEIQNMDTADAIKSLSDKINEILATE